MNVGIIVHKGTARKLMAVVELPVGVDTAKVLANWVAIQGLSKAAVAQFDLVEASVISWDSLKHVDIAFCDQRWCIRKRGDTSMYWQKGKGWGPREEATLYDGYERLSVGIQDGEWEYHGTVKHD